LLKGIQFPNDCRILGPVSHRSVSQSFSSRGTFSHIFIFCGPRMLETTNKTTDRLHMNIMHKSFTHVYLHSYVLNQTNSSEFQCDLCSWQHSFTSIDILCLILNKASWMSCLTSILFRYFDLTFTKLGKRDSNWHVLANGRICFIAFIATILNMCSSEAQKHDSKCTENFIAIPVSALKSMSYSFKSSSSLTSFRSAENGSLINRALFPHATSCLKYWKRVFCPMGWTTFHRLGSTRKFLDISRSTDR